MVVAELPPDCSTWCRAGPGVWVFITNLLVLMPSGAGEPLTLGRPLGVWEASGGASMLSWFITHFYSLKGQAPLSSLPFH